MTNVPLVIKPGIFTEGSARGVKQRWKDGNHVRFRNERPQKIGGRVLERGSQMAGICRCMKFFAALVGYNYIMLGTHERLYVWDSGSMINVTPFFDSTSAPFSSAPLSNPFSTVMGSPIVTVHHTNHGLQVGAFVDYSGVSTVGGLNLNGTFNVATVIDSGHYTIIAGSNATSTVSNGGGTGVDYDYEINIGSPDTFSGLGWGAGPWGLGTWGTARVSSGITVRARTWSLDNWGEDMVANIRGGPLYFWTTANGASDSNRAALISTAPNTCEYMLVSPTDQFLICFGATDNSNPDPMFIRWSDQGDYTDFTPTLQNQAGDKRLDKGTRIITALLARKQILILTDLAAYSMYASGYPDVFGFSDALAEHCGAISPGCAIADPSENIYWMAINNFFIYAGGNVEVLPCDVRNYVFDTTGRFPGINLSQRDKVVAFINSANNEITWPYCSAASTEIDMYVSYNYNNQTWTYGTWDITAWMDMNGAFQNPLACHADSQMYNHETGYDDDTQPLVSFIESYDMEVDEQQLGEADSFGVIRRIIPDFEVLNGSVNISMKAKRFPHQSTYRTKGPYSINSSTLKKNIRIRGRQIAIRIESDNYGDNWIMDQWRLDFLIHGKRG